MNAITPGSVSDPLALARQLIQDGDLTTARHHVRCALTEAPSSAPALTMAGQLSIRTAAHDDAVRYFNRASRAAPPTDPRALLNLARAEEMAGNVDKALTAAGYAARSFPADARPRALMALLHLSRDDLDRALDVLRSDDARETEPDTAYKIGNRLATFKGDRAREVAARYLERAATGTGRFLEPALLEFITIAAMDDPRRFLAARRLLILNPVCVEAMDAVAGILGRRKKLIRQAAWFWQTYCLRPGDLARLARAAELTHKVKWPNHGIAANTLLLQSVKLNLALVNRVCSLLVRDRELVSDKADATARAVAWGQAILAAEPSDPRIWDLIAGLYKDVEAFEVAGELWERIVRRFPAYQSLHYNYGLFLDERSRTADAIHRLRIALVLTPQYTRAANLLSMVVTQIHDLPAAIRHVRWAMCTRPTQATCWVNYGTYLRATGEHGRAADVFRISELLAKEEGDKDMEASSRFNAGMSMIMIGELETGFNRIESRWATRGFPSPKRKFKLPIWSGPRVHPNARLLVYMEQGMGDEVMLSWYLPLLRRDTQRLVVDCDERLVNLLQRTYEGIEFVPRSFEGHPTTRDKDLRYKVPMLHVPQHYAPEMKFLIRDNWDWAERRGERFPARLCLEPTRLQRWDRWLEDRYPGRPRLALSWRSQLRNRNRDQQYLSIEELAAAIPAGTVAVNLQYSSTAEETERLRKLGVQLGFDFVTPEGVDLMNDLEDIFALLQICDAAVTPMISLAWMSSAVGCPAYVFRSSRERVIWQQFGTPFVPWAPSMRLFFRDPSEDWHVVVGDLRTRLSAFLLTQSERRLA